ncbi:AraC family transcriptional regulator [Caenimonas aquaedulcis]|uniref:Helix-turn-helix transcriptional regulator n=1 Tax=Caenimonas aquaedulcis TaxID=2793270 RepID=A0A931H863_9BURK|nr:AraC family transcriptional regulator [Caenimonas aquaedulcis]MBG9390489.1 helix-turn-helix transcriptional regulator [Caenimonas aquaedulcis]
MTANRQSTIFQGEFGRVTLNLTSRTLVEHAHSEFNFIFKVGGGDTAFRVAGADYTLSDDSVILINPWESHAKLASVDGATLALTALVNPPWLFQAANVPATSGVKLFPQALGKLTPGVQEAALRIAMSMTATDVDAGEPETLLRELVQQVVVCFADPELARRSLFSGVAMDARVMRATRYMREKAMDNPGLDDIAREVGLSRSRFFEQFKNCLGVSPQQYLDWQRMALATRMLSQPGSTVADVSFQLGFSAPSHFARFFSQHIGLPPSDFKRGILSQPGPDQG